MKNNLIKIYLKKNKEKLVVAERFIRALENKICKYMTTISENLYRFENMVEIYCNTYHGTFQIKPIDVESST